MNLIIIGGGVIGMLTAREFQRAGISVTLLEKGQTGRESSWAGGGIISPLYPWRYAPAVTQLACWGQEHYQNLCETLTKDTGIDPEWTQNGLLVLSPSQNDDNIMIPEESSQAKNWGREFGIQLESVNQSRLGELEPELSTPPHHGFWLPKVAQVRNPRLVKALRKDLEQRGVRVIESCEVKQLNFNQKRISSLATTQGNFSADKVIICAGAWSGDLAADLTTPPEVNPIKGQMILFRTPPGTISRITLSGNRYIIPRRDGRVLFGSTLEHQDYDKKTTREAYDELYSNATRMLPVLRKFPVEHHWAGLRPGSPAGIPYIGPHPEIEGLWFNTGHFRNGVVLAPASCRLLVNLVLMRSTILPAEPYSLDAIRS